MHDFGQHVSWIPKAVVAVVAVVAVAVVAST